jgi:hypothetical protein
MHPALLDADSLLKECTLGTMRRSGPGGQHRNKTESAVVLTHVPTGVTGQASERRSQADNRNVALRRLRLNLALDVRTPALAERAPTPLWRSRVRNEQIHVNVHHADLPALLAEALDVLADRRGHLHSSAEQLQITPSQLQKLLRLEPRAWELLNTWRRQAGLSPLRVM